MKTVMDEKHGLRRLTALPVADLRAALRVLRRRYERQQGCSTHSERASK